MDLKAKFEQLKAHGNAVANELNMLAQRRDVLQAELIGTQAQMNLLVELDPSLKGEGQAQQAGAGPVAQAPENGTPEKAVEGTEGGGNA